MLSIYLLFTLLAVFVTAIPTETAILPTTKPPAITHPPSIDKRQDLAAISASISSLLNRLSPPPSITSELTAFPATLLTALEGPNVVSAFQNWYDDHGGSWFTSLPPQAESWALGLPAEAATILPQIISLQSVVNALAFTTSPLSTSPTGASTTLTAAHVVTVTATPTGAKGGLKSGEEVGIICGSAVGAMALLLVGIFVYDRRSRNRRERQLVFTPSIPTTGISDGGPKNGWPSGHGGSQGQEIYELHTPDLAYSPYAG